MVRSADVRRHVIPWNGALAAQAAEWLATGWDRMGPLDLSGALVVVGTRQSGRRLREALAELAAAHNQAVLAPAIALPEDLIAPSGGGVATATQIESLVAWVGVLRSVRLESFREVFPIDPPSRDFNWAMRLARQLVHLQATLAEAGLRIGGVTARSGGEIPEAGRWAQLAELERRYDRALESFGKRDEQAACIEFAANPVPQAEFSRVVLLAVPDPMPLAVDVLAAYARRVAVEVVCFGPADEDAGSLFDEWGRPRVDAWSRRALSWPDFPGRIQLCADPADQAARVAECARRHGNTPGVLAVGVADADVAPVVENALRDAGFATFNPAGRPRRRDSLHPLVAALAALARDPSFETAQALARCPDFFECLCDGSADAPAPAAILRELDKLYADHLPVTIADALSHANRFPAARAALAAASELREAMVSGGFPGGAVAVLGRLFEGKKIPAGSRLTDEAAAWMETLRSVGAAAVATDRSAAEDWWDLAVSEYGESRAFDTRPVDAIDLAGWLELLWEDTPHLVLAGLNDGRVPEAVTGDVFLPESLRGRLGLKTNESRFARDAYLLAALGESRAREGRLDVLVGKVSANGDPLRPSRLLFLCADDELPARVQYLFRSVEPRRSSVAWRRAWKLEPRVLPPPGRVSVTALRDYLACPFRFYLKHVLRMETVDPHKTELDALDFGTLCHAALESVGRDPAMRDCADAAVLRDALLAALERLARARYGAELTLPLTVQLESARQRLVRAAEVQAEQRAGGWVIEQVERKFELALGGITVSGKIDRVERNVETGAIRVVDYKTSDQPVTPAAAHVRNEKREETAPAFARFTRGGKAVVWTDFQLPLYREALAAELGAAVGLAYFNLPKAVGETSLVAWDDYDAELHGAALRSAEQVARAVSAGQFWPPTERKPRDEDDSFAGLFHQGAAESVEWKGAR